MGVSRFEDLRVWQAAREQYGRVGDLIKRPEFRADPELCRQMNDASLSTMINISEGFLRRVNREMLQFLRYAFASNGEVKACLYAAIARKYIGTEEAKDLMDLNDSIGRMMRRFMQTISPTTNGQGDATRSRKG